MCLDSFCVIFSIQSSLFTVGYFAFLRKAVSVLGDLPFFRLIIFSPATPHHLFVFMGRSLCSNSGCSQWRIPVKFVRSLKTFLALIGPSIRLGTIFMEAINRFILSAFRALFSHRDIVVYSVDEVQ